MPQFNKNLWSNASVAGLVLGGVSILYLLISYLTGDISASGFGAVMVGILRAALWLGKLYACIALMRYFMKKYAAQTPRITNNGTFRFGSLVSLLSSLVYSGFSLLDLRYIHPNLYDDVIADFARSGSFNNATLEAMEQMSVLMPNYTFFFNFFYCWLFGTILSIILSRKIPSRNPFEDDENGPKIDLGEEE